MALSSGFSPQAQLFTPEQLALIEADYARNPNLSGGAPTVRVANKGKTVTGPLFAGDMPPDDAAPFTSDETLIGPVGLPPAAAALDKAGALSRVELPTGEPTPEGALSRVATPTPRNAPPDIAELLRQYIPEDNSQARYLALAQGFLSPTKTGTFGEQLSNVAGAMQAQKAEQDKTRAHYIPLIMQQVAAQQAREEQNQYRLEAQQQAQAAQQYAARQSAAERAQQAQLQREATDARAAADRASHEQIAGMRFDLMSQNVAAKQAANAMPASSTPTPILGVPVPSVVPWANQSDQKNADKVRAAEIARGAKDVESDADTARKMLGTAQEAQRFMELNAKKDTGGITDKFGLGQFAQSFGSDYAEMQGISSRLVPGLREAGSGSTSDFDAKMFQKGTVGVDKPKETNAAIAQGYINRAKQAQDYADFRATYLEQNGTLQGANKHWAEYVNSNPIFDKNYAEVPRLNDKRLPWRDYFASKVGGAISPAPVGGSPSVDPVAAARAELARRQGGK